MSSFNMWIARKLERDAEIAEAKALLYRIYIQEMAWQFEASNPSGIRIEQDPSGRKILTDDLESFATWFGAFKGDDLIGCLRLVRPKESKLEFELYKKHFPDTKNSQRNFWRELNRFAVEKEERSSVAPVCLIREAGLECANQQVQKLFVAVSFPQPFELCRQLGFEATDNLAFKYAEGDPNFVKLMILQSDKQGALESMISVCDQILETSGG